MNVCMYSCMYVCMYFIFNSFIVQKTNIILRNVQIHFGDTKGRHKNGPFKICIYAYVYVSM